ncbi:Flp family type IVb pilin [Pasteurella sp. PK-2025]|uniref:Flp family type IVb pilin n=1 Tax=unclassified Pasteurella TaxID=2621516 RepID=UPI003C71ED4E
MNLFSWFYFKFQKVVKSNQGVTSIEYGLIAVAVAVFLVSILSSDNSFLVALKEQFSILSKTVTNAVSGIN